MHPIELINKGISWTAAFIYETPATVIASLVMSVALLALIPSFARPLLSFSFAALLTRSFVKLIGKSSPKFLSNFNEHLDSFHSKYGKLVYIALIISTLFSPVITWVGTAFAVGVGIYEGIVNEIEIYRLKQELKRDRAPPPPGARHPFSFV